MKCWELTSLSSSPLLYTPRIPQTDQFSPLYIPLFDPTATAYPPGVCGVSLHMLRPAKHLSTPNYRMEVCIDISK